MCEYPNYYKKIFIKIYKKNLSILVEKKLFFVHSINMQNIPQNTEIMHINNEINLSQDLLKKNEKIQNQF